MNNKHLLASVLLIGLATRGSAGAADLRSAPITKAPVAAAPAVFNWTGFYAGLNAGYGWGDDPVRLSGDPFSLFVEGATLGLFPTTLATDPRGFVGGGQIGWNYQSGPAVFGLEADLDGTGIKSSGTIAVATGAGLGVARTLTASQQLDWLATFRGRLGYTPTDRLLLYATGGGAAGGAKAAVSLTTNDLPGFPGSGCVIGTCETASLSKTLWGWSLGAGVEYAVSGNWLLRAEYLHYDLGSINITAIDPVFGPGSNVTNASARFRGEIVRGAVNYKFDWGGPAPRY